MYYLMIHGPLDYEIHIKKDEIKIKLNIYFKFYLINSLVYEWNLLLPTFTFIPPPIPKLTYLPQGIMQWHIVGAH